MGLSQYDSSWSRSIAQLGHMLMQGSGVAVVTPSAVVPVPVVAWARRHPSEQLPAHNNLF